LLFSAFTTNIFSQNYPWQQKLIVKDFAGNYKGWIKIFISTCSVKTPCQQNNVSFFYSTNLSSDTLYNHLTKQSNNSLTEYLAIIVSDTDLPFWFFSGKSKTIETEYFDENFFPLESDFDLVGETDIFKIITKKSSDTFNISWKPSKGKIKEKVLPAHKNILTAGNLRNIIMSLDLDSYNSKTFFLLDKFKLETKKIIVSTGEKKVINNIESYGVTIDMSLFSKFTFWIDKNYNVVFGEGMGIKVYPEK